LKEGENRGAESDDCRRQAAANPVFRRFYQPWTVFRYAQYQWYRIAEASFSNFMAGQRLPFK